ncbi:hypothetical protein [Chromobacterium haemolyticum]|uniref:hypothetical protein n=1 Tax=Chromobacterium haemolyticum TaxID=394935 RepID=UPI0017471EC1|nr:hypothetical protein [Chromobacterium haemolyticum]QOD81861.1 hypothetical protein IEZ30_18490 [Chromobacterium haemolyticum]
MSTENNRLVLLPYRLTAENGAKTLLSSVFYETIIQTCSACHFDEPQDDCEVCGGEVEYEQKVMISWDTIKEIWKAAADEFVLGERETDQARSGKWRVCTQHPYRILQDDGRPVMAAIGGGHEEPFAPEENYARARRVVAAWNACQGVSTDDLESSPGYLAAIQGFHEQRELVMQARAQRDQLLAALEGMAEEFRQHDLPYGSAAYAKAITAINATKGGAA